MPRNWEHEETVRLLKEHHAVLVRQKKHNIWKLPSGKIFVSPQTPSDCKGDRAQLCNLRKLLGIQNSETRVGERRERKRKHGVAKPSAWASPAVGVDVRSWKKQISLEDLRALAAHRVHVPDQPPTHGLLTITRTPLTTLLRRMLCR